MAAGYAILDDFLEEADWTALWTHFQFVELLPVTRTVGAWKLDDGVPLGGQEITTPAREAELAHDPEQPQLFPTETPLDAVIRELLAAKESWEPVVGDNWTHVSARPYVYPHGTGLSWHKDDHEIYAGAFIYYAHPRWNAHWGGELLVADEAPGTELGVMAYRFENEGYSERLLETGAGSFVMPKPNRLVVLSGAPHKIAPVSAAAGDHVRASVAGFFLH